MSSNPQPTASCDPSAIRLSSKLAQFDQHWSPRMVATVNGHDIMVVKVKGEFVWHSHDETDDLFLVLSGRLTNRSSADPGVAIGRAVAPVTARWSR